MLGRVAMEQLQDCFAVFADPRTGNSTRYDLLEMLTIALCATLSGPESRDLPLSASALPRAGLRGVAYCL